MLSWMLSDTVRGPRGCTTSVVLSDGPTRAKTPEKLKAPARLINVQRMASCLKRMLRYQVNQTFPVSKPRY